MNLKQGHPILNVSRMSTKISGIIWELKGNKLSIFLVFLPDDNVSAAMLKRIRGDIVSLPSSKNPAESA